MRRTTASLLLASLGASCVLMVISSPAALADPGTVHIDYSNGTAWPAPPNGPQNMYGSTQKILAASTTGEPVKFSASGGCSVVPIDAMGAPSQAANVTGTNGGVDCTLTASAAAGNGLDAASVTYVLKSIATGQVVKYGSVMNQSTVKVNKTYVLGTYPLKTDQGKPVTFAIAAGAEYCKVTKDKSKGWLLKVGSKKGKCSVQATADGVPPNYASLNRQQAWSVVN